MGKLGIACRLNKREKTKQRYMDFKPVASFSSRLEAETVGHTLDKERIPFMIKSDDIGGIFGSGSSGNSPNGTTLLVPEHRYKQTKELLHGLIKRPLRSY